MDCQNHTWVRLTPRSHHFCPHSLLSLLAWATWAEVAGPGGVSGQKSDFGSSMYPSIGAGTKIEFLTDQGKTLRNEYLLCKNFKTSFRFFVPRTVFSLRFGPGRLGSVVN